MAEKAPEGQQVPMTGVPPVGYAQPPHGMPPAGYAPPPHGMPPAGYAPPPQGVPPNIPGMQTQWMARPTQVFPGCPPGLEYLTQLDQVLVHQQVELFEVMTGFEMNNRYAIKNSLGQQCYYAYEDTDLCMRMCCGNQRGFKFHIVDNAGQEVLRISREFKCCAGCCWCANADCCAWEVQIEAPAGNVIGSVRQTQSCWYSHMDLKNESGDNVLRIVQGVCCICPGPCCTCDFNFDVYPTTGDTPIGAVTKQYSGFAKECITKANNFSVTFPKDLDVKMKGTLLGACFLIDMMFFEQNKNNNN